MSNAIVSTDSVALTTFAAQVDAKLGYPIAGVDVGGGVHAPASQSVTVTQAAIAKHPTLAEWAYPQTPDVVALTSSAKVTIPVGATVAPLDATWTPAAPVATATVATVDAPATATDGITP